MKRFLLFFILLSATIGLSQESYKSKSPEARDAYNRGLNLVNKEEYKEAISLFQEAIKFDPLFASAFHMLGVAEHRLENTDAAITAFQKAIESDKQFEPAYITLGMLFMDRRQFKPALKNFNAVLAFNNKSCKAYFGIGNTYREMKAYQSAIPPLQKAVELDKGYDLAWDVLGICYEKENRLEESACALQSAINCSGLVSSKGTYYYRLGNVYLLMHKYNDAESAFRNSLHLSKLSNVISGSNFGLGEVYKNLGQIQKAIEYFKQAAQDRNWKGPADYEIDALINPEKYTN